MLIPDVNVLIYAYRDDSRQHEKFRKWLDELVNAEEPFGMSDFILSGFLRIVTNPRVYKLPTPIRDALNFANSVRSRPNCVGVAPGPRHWEIFTRLCDIAGAKGNLVPDAYFAALAIESGSEWITTDGDYGRFPGLRWRRPF
jgi:uncharacterized protein